MFRRRQRVVSGFEPEASTFHPDRQLKSPAGEIVVPVYIVCDESASMEINGGIAAINQALPNLHAEIAADPLVSDMFLFGLIFFSDEAEELMSLTKLSDVVAMPGMQARGLTNYGPVFDLLKRVISRDIASLKSGGYEVLRPLVFFITDGNTTDNLTWENSYRSLMDKATFRQFPNIFAIGFEGADEMTVSGVGSVAAVIFDPDFFYLLGLSWAVGWYRETLFRAGLQLPAMPMPGARNIGIREI
jgi:uncharacterized protein YegL